MEIEITNFWNEAPKTETIEKARLLAMMPLCILFTSTIRLWDNMIFQVIWAILALLLLLIQLSALILQIRWHKLEQRDLLKELEKYKNY